MAGKRKIESKIDFFENDAHRQKFSVEEMLEQTINVLFRYNFQTLNYDYLSDSILDMTGYSRDEILANSSEWLIENMHPDDKPAFLDLFLACKNNTLKEDKISREYRFAHKNGHTIWVDEQARVIRDSNDNIIAIAGCSRDVTLEKQLRQQLEDSKRKYKELYRNAKVALFRTRISDGKYLACNLSMAKMIGYDSIEACLESHMTPDFYVDKNRRKELLDELQKNNRVENFPLQVKRIDGSIAWISITAEAFPKQGWLEGIITDNTAAGILTKTELEVLKYILSGKSNKEIARHSKRSIRTIEDHRSHIMHKLSVDNVVDLTRKALKYGITPDGE